MARQQRDRDIDGDRVKLPARDSVVRIIELLEWARRRGFRIGPTIQVGDVIMQVDDLRQAKQEGIGFDAGPQDGGVYAEAGLKEEDEPVPGTAG